VAKRYCRPVSPRRVALNRFTDDRLWDGRGREWIRRPVWLEHDEVDRLLDAGLRLGTHRYREPVYWQTKAEARHGGEEAEVILRWGCA